VRLNTESALLTASPATPQNIKEVSMNALLGTAPTPHRAVLPPRLLPLALSSPGTTCREVSCFASQPGLLDISGYHCFKLLFLENGEGWYRTGQGETQAVPGDLFLIAPGEVYDPRGLENTRNWLVVFGTDILVPGQTDSNGFLILLEDLLLPSFLQPQGIETRHFQVKLGERPRWLERLQRLEYELCEQPAGFAEAACTLLTLLLIDTARLAAPQLNQYLPQFPPLLNSVFRFIEAHYRSQIGLAEVAKAVDRSPAYLTNLVHRETGRTVLGWILERRMAEARRLLLVTNQSVQQIAKAVGYLDTGHFIRQFRQCSGTTPQVWRQEQRK